MRYICGGLATACLISLSGVALAEDFVNAETDPRAIVLRDAEIARAGCLTGANSRSVSGLDQRAPEYLSQATVVSTGLLPFVACE